MDTSNDGPNNGFWSLPGLLRSHCMAAELDWAINQTLAGAKPKRGSKAIDKERKTKEVDLMAKGVAWEVLARVLHDENLLPNGYAIPSSILVGIAAQLQDSNAATDALILHVGRVLQTMCALKQQEAKGGQMSNVQMSSRLDHCVALATAALSVDSKSIGSSWEEHKVAYHAIMLLEIQIRGAINRRKVWDMVIPNHLPVFLISAFSPALTSNEPLQLACRRILRDVIFAPEHLSSLQEAFDIEPERRSAVKTASYATQLLFQMDQLLMGDESLESTEAALVSLPWFVHEFCTAYNAHTELFNKKTASLTLDGEHGEGEEGTKDESNKTKPDFNPAFRCFESFSRNLMSTWADRQTKDPKYKGEMLLR